MNNREYNAECPLIQGYANDVPQSQERDNGDNHKARRVLKTAVGGRADYFPVVEDNEKEDRGHGQDQPVGDLGKDDDGQRLEFHEQCRSPSPCPATLR